MSDNKDQSENARVQYLTFPSNFPRTKERISFYGQIEINYFNSHISDTVKDLRFALGTTVK